MPAVNVSDEYSALRSVIVGRAGKACFPPEKSNMIKATMPPEYASWFKRASPFPAEIVRHAEEELDLFSKILENEGIQVIRPPPHIDWLRRGGYTGAMPRDGLLTVGNTILESLFAWNCRSTEVETAYGGILGSIAKDSAVRVIRRPPESLVDTLGDLPTSENRWAINNSRPALEAADFMRFGTTLIGQYSHVTNRKGVDYLRSQLSASYSVEILDVNDPSAMHIDATILPLRKGLLVYNPTKVTEASLRAHAVFQEWELIPFPFVPKPPRYPPLFMTSPWLCLNVLVIGEDRLIVEAHDTESICFFESLGMTCIPCPFQHVNSIGGSFHCATVDLVRDHGLRN